MNFAFLINYDDVVASFYIFLPFFSLFALNINVMTESAAAVLLPRDKTAH